MPIDPTPQGELLTTAEVAKLLKISVSSVRRLESARVLPFGKIAGGPLHQELSHSGTWASMKTLSHKRIITRLPRLCPCGHDGAHAEASH